MPKQKCTHEVQNLLSRSTTVGGRLHVCVLGHVQLFATPWIVDCQALLSTGFPRQEYWSGLPFPSPGDLPNTGIKPVSLTSPALGRQALYHWCHLGEQCINCRNFGPNIGAGKAKYGIIHCSIFNETVCLHNSGREIFPC